MINSTSTINIKHSPFFALPAIGSLAYKIEKKLIDWKMLNTVFLSRGENTSKNKLLTTISERFQRIICKSYKLANSLKSLNKNEIILDYQVKEATTMSEKDQHLIMWSLVYANSVTTKTKNSLKGLIPENYPVNKTIVIPYNDSFEVVCDYIFQTAKVLANKGNCVYLVSVAEPKSFLKFFVKKEIQNLQRRVFFEKNNIQVVYPLTLFPIRLEKSSFIKKINKSATLLYLQFFIKNLNTDYLWCFDPSDHELVRRLKNKVKTLYDCVDYFSSLDKSIDKKIKINEKKLIKSVDFFFVNSFALRNVKKKLREPNAVVVQGFDLVSMSTNGTPLPEEKREISNMKQILKNIPKPVVGFVGALTYRFDFKLVYSLIKSMPNVSFVFTDFFLPMPDDDRLVGTADLMNKIRSMKNAYFVPKTHFRSVIKEILKKFDIGIIPYDVGFDFNRYCFPMKMFEYFYMGLPVISTPIEEVKRFPNLVKIGNNANEWKKHIEFLLSKKWSKKQIASQMKTSIENSWENKVEAICRKIV